MTKELTVLAPFTVQLTGVAPPESLMPVSGSSFSLLVVLFPVFNLESFGSIHAQHVAHHMWSKNVGLSLTERVLKKIATPPAELQILARGLRISWTEAVWCFPVTDSLEANLSVY